MEHFNALVNGNTGGAFALIGTLTKICNSPILMRKDDGKETTNPHVKAAMQLLPAKAQATDVALSGTKTPSFHLALS